MRWIKILAWCGFVFGAFPELAAAATKRWIAPPEGGDRRWSVSANWNPSGAPQNGDSLLFDDHPTLDHDPSTNNLSGLRLASITINAVVNLIGELRGNAITLSNGISLSGNASCFIPITLGASQTFEVLTDGALFLHNNISLGPHTLTLDTRLDLSRFTIRGGSISGSGNLTLTGSGTFQFQSDRANGYTGLTRHFGRSLTLSAQNLIGGFTSVPGGLIVGDGTNPSDVSILAGDQIHGPVTLNAGCRLGMSEDTTDTIGPLTMIDAVIRINTSGGFGEPPGVLGLDSVTVGGTTNSLIDGFVTLGAATRTFSISNNVELRMMEPILATVTGAPQPGIIKIGNGTLLLLTSNLFAGNVTIDDGRVIVAASGALGTANPFAADGHTFVNDGGELLLSAVRITNEVLTLATTQGGLSSTGICAWIGNIIVNTNVPINVSNSSLTLDGAISGPGGLVKRGAGGLALDGNTANTFTGPIRIDAGLMLLSKPAGVRAVSGSITLGDGTGGAGADVLRIGADEQIDDTASVSIGFSGQLDLDAEETINGLNGFGQVRLDGGELTVGAGGSSAGYFGLISGTFGLTKIGNGTQILTEDNTYSGLTRVLAGTLHVNGSQPRSPVNVIGAALEGRGTVGNVTCSGRLSPGGPAPAAFSTSNLVFQSGGSLEIQIGSIADQLIVRGSVQLANATLNLSFINGFLPPSGSTYVILDNDGADAIVGTFAGLPNNSDIVVEEGKKFRIQYNGGDGNDVVLMFINETISRADLLISAGNGNGRMDPNECNLLGGSLSNRTSQVISNVTLELFPASRGVTVSHPIIHLGDLAPHANTPVPALFVVAVAREVPCGSTVELELLIRSGGVLVSSAPHFFMVGPGGPGACPDGGGICAYCPEVVINGSLVPGDLEQSAQLRPGSLSTCSRESTCPGAGSPGTRLVDAMVFQNGPRSACVSVTLSNRCTSGVAELFAAAYGDKFDPDNLCQNYLADSGNPVAATQGVTFEFRLGANESFVITVNEFTAAAACRDYTVRVKGGDCRPRLEIANIPGPSVRLSWPSSAAEWQPEISSALTTWSDLVEPRTHSAGRIRMDTTDTLPSRFFRLREP